MRLFAFLLLESFLTCITFNVKLKIFIDFIILKQNHCDHLMECISASTLSIKMKNSLMIYVYWYLYWIFVYVCLNFFPYIFILLSMQIFCNDLHDYAMFVPFEKISFMTVTVCAKYRERKQHIYENLLAHTVGNL